jgi:hypothetical protein
MQVNVWFMPSPTPPKYWVRFVAPRFRQRLAKTSIAERGLSWATQLFGGQANSKVGTWAYQKKFGRASIGWEQNVHVQPLLVEKKSWTLH